MEQNEKIELSSIQTTAYWWTNVVRNKVRELAIEGTKDKDEMKFVEKFYNYTEKDWRNLYLELVNYITEDVNNYVPIGNIMDIDAFNQDTAENGHDRINEELSKIMNCSIPDIRLTSLLLKDSVIYTTMSGVSVWYKSCGVRKLSTKHNPSYVLTGDEEELSFYNSIISTIVILKEKDKSFNSVLLLKNVFCKEYKKQNKLQEDLNELADRFDQVLEKASDRGIILGSYWKGTYISNFCDIDYFGLEEYMEIAEYYANIILQKNKHEVEKGYSKKLK